jgi:hypothetical protein
LNYDLMLKPIPQTLVTSSRTTHIGGDIRRAGTSQLVRAGGGTGGYSPEEPAAVEETGYPGCDAHKARIATLQ